jgi:carbonic anhydrase
MAILLSVAGAKPLLGADGAGAAEQDKLRRLYRDASLQLLKEGNQRFVAGKSQHPSVEEPRRIGIARDGQEPFVTVLSCSDSRVPPELLFDRGLGELFVIRIAGNVADIDEIATAEYGVGHLHTPLVIVLGHSKCGAVTAVATGAELHGMLPGLVDNIQPAVKRAKAATSGELVANSIRENVWQSVEDLVTKSEAIHKACRQGAVRVLGAIYDLESGKVDWLGEHPEMATFLDSPAVPPPGAGGHGSGRLGDLPPGVAPPIGPPTGAQPAGGHPAPPPAARPAPAAPTPGH